MISYAVRFITGNFSKTMVHLKNRIKFGVKFRVNFGVNSGVILYKVNKSL